VVGKELTFSKVHKTSHLYFSTDLFYFQCLIIKYMYPLNITKYGTGRVDKVSQLPSSVQW